MLHKALSKAINDIKNDPDYVLHIIQYTIYKIG